MPETSWDLRFLDKYDRLLRKKFKEAADLSLVYPDASLGVLRAFSELLLDQIAKQHNLPLRGQNGSRGEKFFQFINRLRAAGCLPDDTAALFHEIRNFGNKAAHLAELAPANTAVDCLAIARKLAFWFEERVCGSSPELEPEFRIGLVVHSIREQEHLILLTKNNGRWVTPTCRLRDMTLPHRLAQSFGDRLLRSKVALRGPIDKIDHLNPEWETDTESDFFSDDVIEASKLQPILLCFQEPGDPKARIYEHKLRSLVVRKRGAVKLVLLYIKDSADIVKMFAVQSAPAVGLIVDGICKEILYGIRTEAEVDAFLQCHGIETPYGGPIVGSINTTYYMAHCDYIASVELNKSSDSHYEWIGVPQLLEVRLGMHTLRPITAAVEILFRCFNRAKSQMFSIDWYKRHATFTSNLPHSGSATFDLRESPHKLPR